LAEATALLRVLVTEDPHNRRFRQKLYLATGLELCAAGHVDEARRELERSAALEPEPAEAAEALRKVQATRKGLLGKLFGR
jgi:hypothetical protein